MLNLFTLTFNDEKLADGFKQYRYRQMQKPFFLYLIMAGTFAIYRIYLTSRGGFDWNLESRGVTDTTS